MAAAAMHKAAICRPAIKAPSATLVSVYTSRVRCPLIYPIHLVQALPTSTPKGEMTTSSALPSRLRHPLGSSTRLCCSTMGFLRRQPHSAEARCALRWGCSSKVGSCCHSSRHGSSASAVSSPQWQGRQGAIYGAATAALSDDPTRQRFVYHRLLQVSMSNRCRLVLCAL